MSMNILILFFFFASSLRRLLTVNNSRGIFSSHVSAQSADARAPFEAACRINKIVARGRRRDCATTVTLERERPLIESSRGRKPIG